MPCRWPASCLRGAAGEQRVRALGVAVEGEQFAWRELDPSPELEQAVRHVARDACPRRCRTATCPRSACPSSRGSPASPAQLEHGVALLIDYGLPRAHLYHPQRSAGTLRCHFRHRAHDDPFVNVGLQDITAWVDFTRVAEAADGAGLEVLGFTTQAAFLIGAGMDSLLTTEMQLAGDDAPRPRATRGRSAAADAAGRDGRDLQGHRARARPSRTARRLRHPGHYRFTVRVKSSARSSPISAHWSNNLSPGCRGLLAS